MTRRQPVRSNKGFTLIELMIAMFLIMVTMLATLSSTLLVMRNNLDNEMRTTSIRIMNQTGEALMALPLGQSVTSPELSDGHHNRVPNNADQNLLGFPDTVQTVRGSRQNFTIAWDVLTLSDASVQIDIKVGYNFRGRDFTRDVRLYKEKKI